MKRTKRFLASLLLCCLMMNLVPALAEQSAFQPYWARSGGTSLYANPGQGVKRVLKPVEVFRIVGEQGEWLEVNTVASGNLFLPGFVHKNGVYSVEDRLYQTMAVVNNPDPQDRLHLRTAPRQNSSSKLKFYSGALAFVHDLKDGWAHVDIGGEEGYMEARFLYFGKEGLGLNLMPPTVTVQNLGGRGLNLRSAPRADAPTAGVWPNGSQMTLLGLTREWAFVQGDGGKTGFMMLKHLTPRPEYDLKKAETETAPRPVTKPSQPQAGSWPDNTGPHAVADWPFTMGGLVAAVQNPVATDRLHLRTKPDSSAPSLGKYYNGVQVQVLGSAVDGWLPVQVGILKGYMDHRFLSASVTNAMPQAVSAMPVIEIYNPGSAGNLHLRERQAMTSRSLGLYDNGTQVILMGFDTNWAHVIVGTTTGFMHKDFLR